MVVPVREGVEEFRELVRPDVDDRRVGSEDPADPGRLHALGIRWAREISRSRRKPDLRRSVATGRTAQRSTRLFAARSTMEAQVAIS
jgi:hypothetical protein